jgi:hypothetical protein
VGAFPFVGASLVAMACGGGKALTTGPNGPIPQAEFLPDVAHALCDHLEHCCSANGLPYDQGACLAAAMGQVQRGFSPTAPGYDPNAASDFVTLYADTVVQRCTLTADDERVLDQLSARVFDGAKKAGGACTAGIECARPPLGFATCRTYVTKAGSAAQTCQQRTPAKLGDPCGADSAGKPLPVIGDCETDDPALYCDPARGTCQPRKGLEQPCVAGGCVPDTYCAGTCHEPLGAGSSCAPGGGAAPVDDPCDRAATYCDTTGAKTCAQQKPPGSACALDVECTSGACASVAGGPMKCLSNGLGAPAFCVAPR